jgi:hypothetical protein
MKRSQKRKKQKIKRSCMNQYQLKKYKIKY